MKLILVACVGLVVGEEQCEDGVVKTTVIGEEKTQKDYYEKASHYDTIWGSDNLHLGYYPHLDVASGTRVRYDHMQAASMLTEKMIRMAGIRAKTRVVDLGAGKGIACYEMASLTGAACTGLDLTPANVVRGNEIAAAHPDLDLDFVEGSFTSLPDSLVERAPFDVVFAQVSFCHVHQMLDKIFREATKLMGPDSVFIVNDYLGGDGETSDDTKEHVFKRLHFEMLHGPIKWRSIADQAGLRLVNYECLDKHVRQSYLDMAAMAKAYGFNSTDGTPLSVNYEHTAEAIERGEIGMNLAVFTL